MKRDMGLIRQVLLAVEAGEDPDKIEGYDSDEIRYHQALVIEAGLAEGKMLDDLSNTTQVPANVFIKKLTWQGHEFIDLMKQSEIWNTIQRDFKEASFGTVIKVARELAEGWAKKRVNDLLSGNS
ncbi:DUF2513 domain-containing protein [Marinobacter sp. AN1]|uniref:DUF2513 domain-containing protein n=1 Tax=Marinobacter sp. AN1 TaxID=2886046 RepID=UPI0022314E05|nr:DUF2513 domain-containing protein [Marinobacter sp. AN1]UZD65584.1 DUF2513 domain-containing protein [Marinobacter sp. AN1]